MAPGLRLVRGGALAGALALAGTGCAAAPPPGIDAWSRRAERQALQAADAVDPAAVVVERRPWRFAGRRGELLVTPHHRLYTTVDAGPFLDRLPEFMEAALRHYTSALGSLPPPASPLETYLFAGRNEWEAKARQMLRDEAPPYLTLGRGGFTTRGVSVLYDIGRGDTLAIAAHEGWHQYAQRALRARLPLWLEEGLATYMEGHVVRPDGRAAFLPWANLERYHALREAQRRDALIPLRDLLRRPPRSFLEEGKHHLLTYYAQVWALTHFLAEGEGGRYRSGLRRMLLDAVRGRALRRARWPAATGGAAALALYVEPDLEAFEAAYLRFVRAVVRLGGRTAIIQGRSPLPAGR